MHRIHGFSDRRANPQIPSIRVLPRQAPREDPKGFLKPLGSPMSRSFHSPIRCSSPPPTTFHAQLSPHLPITDRPQRVRSHVVVAHAALEEENPDGWRERIPVLGERSVHPGDPCSSVRRGGLREDCIAPNRWGRYNVSRCGKRVCCEGSLNMAMGAMHSSIEIPYTELVWPGKYEEERPA